MYLTAGQALWAKWEMHTFYIKALSRNIAYIALALVTQQETARIYEVEDIYS